MRLYRGITCSAIGSSRAAFHATPLRNDRNAGAPRVNFLTAHRFGDSEPKGISRLCAQKKHVKIKFQARSHGEKCFLDLLNFEIAKKFNHWTSPNMFELTNTIKLKEKTYIFTLIKISFEKISFFFIDFSKYNNSYSK